MEYSGDKKATDASKKEWKIPFKWKNNMRKSNGKANKDKVLVIYLSANYRIEPPMLLPVMGGNIVIYKDKAHEFDPSDLFLLKSGKNIVKVLIIREIDRKPVSNKDWAEVKQRGDSTRDDEVLLKMLKLAMVEKVKKAINTSFLWILGLIAAAVVGYMIFFK